MSSKIWDFEEFERVYDEGFAGQYGFFRPYVKQVIYRYLDCGILHNGFARVKCGDCGQYMITNNKVPDSTIA